MPDADTLRRLLLPAAVLLLVASWLGGGATEDPRPVDEWVLLLSLPVLALAVAVLTLDGSPSSAPVRWGIAGALLIAAVPLLQLLPVPAEIWQLSEARAAMAADLAAAGAAPVASRWSLTPGATEQAFWALMPALAALMAGLALSATQRRRLLQVVLALILFNVAFAFFQAGLPRDSSLRLYPDFIGGFGGLLVNTNHQATACIIGMVLAIGLAMEARLRARNGQARPHTSWWYWGAALALFLLVPLSTSRAGMAIALPALAAALVLTGALQIGRLGRSKRAAGIAIVLAVVAIVGVRAAMGWMAVDQAEELRHVLSSAAFDIGKQHAPLGSGIGSFRQAFEPDAPQALWLASYVNHAHNEYAQWWLTGGWLGMLVLAAVLAVLTWIGWRLMRLYGGSRHAALAGASYVAILAALAHSWADYPLRTTTLMAAVAAVAGVMLASLGEALERQRNVRASQRQAAAT